VTVGPAVTRVRKAPLWNDRGSGIEKFPTVMLADSKRVQANLIGVLDLLH